MSLEFQFSDDLYFAIKGAYSVNILITKSGFYCEYSTYFFQKIIKNQSKMWEKYYWLMHEQSLVFEKYGWAS